MIDTSSKTINEIKALLAELGGASLDELLIGLEHDTRIGIRKLLDSYQRELSRVEANKKLLIELTSYERKLQDKGFKYIAGVDEAGRGALAGPLVAAGVILPKTTDLYGLRDSKRLSPDQREVLFDRIIETAIAWHVIRVEHSDIDRKGIQWANLYALEQAVLGLHPGADFALSDAFPIKSLDIPHLAIVKGDDRSLTIAAASVVAKVTRDRIMRDYHDTYPQYGFDQHKGYGTASHIYAIKLHGVSAIHRKYFSPVAEYEQLSF